MRIDFFHVNLLDKSLEIKGVSDVDTDCDTSSQYNYSSEASRTQKSHMKYTRDYLDIQDKLHTNLSKDKTLSNEGEFISDEDLLNFKRNIKNNEYSINTKALSLSLIKYMERN